MSENNKNVPLIIHDLQVHTKWSMWDTDLSFLKRADFKISHIDNGNSGSLGGKVQFSVYIHVICFINFPE